MKCFLLLSYKVRLLKAFVKEVSAELRRPYFRSDPENCWLKITANCSKLITEIKSEEERHAVQMVGKSKRSQG